jgi:hypothetical protein
VSNFITSTSTITDVALTVPNLTGGSNQRVVRLNGSNSVVNADQGDSAAQLNTVLIKSANVYYAGGVITGFANLAPGQAYFLSTTGNITATPPVPSASVRTLYVGFAVNGTDLLFRPGIPVSGI